ncbi:hypothetical protein MT325_m364R [Paramecium bursaria chlorella virus MT325]|uniref:Uncharacterized protein m364R n=1 Tax=Paramecium bursaria Chlorella virus MT325 TaxID=346932 RepID=A7IU94_PBCVM|nr:hypothetical protein MT325_m364R [Paramecium bursaria chlorella virus MT325]
MRRSSSSKEARSLSTFTLRMFPSRKDLNPPSMVASSRSFLNHKLLFTLVAARILFSTPSTNLANLAETLREAIFVRGSLSTTTGVWITRGLENGTIYIPFSLRISEKCSTTGETSS